MKKIASIITTLGICLLILLPMTASAASASASLTGPGTVRAGDTITLNFNLNGSNLSGASGTLSYDSSQVTLSGTKQKIAAPWAVEFNGNNFVAYDNNLTNPINGNKALFTVTFKVKDVSAGTKINISYTNVKVSDGNADANVGTVTYSATVAAPLSGNVKLSSLTVGNATISPAFHAETTSYTASVPFDVSKLDVKATAEDAKSTISISNPTLTPGGTTNVVITVKAESGAKKSYTIKVTRAQDPNYKASSNNNLANISVDGFLLSPAFNADTTKYVIWLPYETTSVKVSGKAADSKAQGVEVIGGDKLLAGQDNEIKVICTAEDGSKKEYIVVAKRAAAHDGSVDEKPVESTVSELEKVTSSGVSTGGEAKSSGAPIWLVVVIGIVGLAVGAGVGVAIGKKMR